MLVIYDTRLFRRWRSEIYSAHLQSKVVRNEKEKNGALRKDPPLKFVWETMTSDY